MLILFNATTTTKLYSLSLHDALPIYSRIFLKRAPEKKSGDLVWFPVPPLAAVSPNKDIPVSQPTPVPVLHGLSFREFSISPDGRLLGVVVPGKRNLLVFPLPH